MRGVRASGGVKLLKGRFRYAGGATGTSGPDKTSSGVQEVENTAAGHPLQQCRHISFGSIISKLNPFESTSVTGVTARLDDRFELLEELGRGRYGVVYRCKRLPQHNTECNADYYAIKVVHKDSVDHLDELRTELEIMERIEHPHCVGLTEAFEDVDKVYFVSPLCVGGELFDRIIAKGFYTEADAAKLIRQVLLALEYCHETLHVVHRDIKPENLLFWDKDEQSALGLCDFGMAHPFKNDELMHSSCGSPSYVAPEVLDGNYNEKCDIWSAGVILYILLSGSVPFPGESDTEIMRNVARAQYDFDDIAWDSISDSAKELIQGMVCKDHTKRMSASQCLHHKWIRELGEGREVPLLLALENLRAFDRFARIKRIALQLVAKHLASCANHDEMDSYIMSLREFFDCLAKDNGGLISAEDLAQAIVKESQKENSFNVLTTAEDLVKLLDNSDLDRNGMIDLNEFCAACLNEYLLTKETELRWVFEFIDHDSDGVISLEDLRKEYGDSESYESLKEEFDRYDLNNDGVISYEEFTSGMKKSP